MGRILDLIEIPEFGKYIRKPNEKTCKIIDETRLMVEILGGLKNNREEFSKSDFSEKLILDGDYSIVLRYKRERDNKSYVAGTLSFRYENNVVIVDQLQGSKDNKIGFRVNSSFFNVDFYLDMLEKSFSQKGILIELEKSPKGIEDKSIHSKADLNYGRLRRGIEVLNSRYIKK